MLSSGFNVHVNMKNAVSGEVYAVWTMYTCVGMGEDVWVWDFIQLWEVKFNKARKLLILLYLFYFHILF